MNEEAVITTKPRKHRAMIAAVLAASLAGAMTVAGISAASSSPNEADSPPATVTSPGPADQSTTGEFGPEDCERYAEQNGWSGHDNMEQMMEESGFMNGMDNSGFMGGMGSSGWGGMGSMGSMGF